MRRHIQNAHEAVAAAHRVDPSATNEQIGICTGFHANTVARYRKRVLAASARTQADASSDGLLSAPGAGAMSAGTGPELDPAEQGLTVNELLARIVTDAYAAHLGERLDGFDPRIRRAGANQNADYQANGIIGDSRRRRLDPAVAAAAAAETIGEHPAVSGASGSGPGFVNITMSDQYLGAQIGHLSDTGDGELGESAGRRVVVDYSSPNVAKEMHVGHLRSTIIGDALVRMFELDGADVVLQNHIGDWGTPYGMLIEHLLDTAAVEQVAEMTAKEMGGLYRAARKRFDNDDSFANSARQRVVALQSGDPVSTQAWNALRDASKRHFSQIYRDLGVLLDDDAIHGESAYHSTLPEVIAELESKGLLTESDGALCVFLEGFTARDGSPLPLIVRKADGGYNYATTDLAAVRYRTQQLKADHLVYVVGAPQSTHLAMVFAAAEKAGWLDGVEATHVAFGSVLGTDGKMLKSREGEPASLSGLLRTAVQQVTDVAADRAGVTDSDLAAIAVSAVKYADLSTNRVNDYIFDPQRMASWDGDTGPYLMYAHTRAAAVLRRGGVKAGQKLGTQIEINHPTEHHLALKLLEFDHDFEAALAQLDPQGLCAYAYSLARAFTSFYEQCPVLDAGTAAMSGSRLRLCQTAAARLRQALWLLGIEIADRM